MIDEMNEMTDIKEIVEKITESLKELQISLDTINNQLENMKKKLDIIDKDVKDIQSLLSEHYVQVNYY